MYINKAFILGNLTKEAELKSLPTGVKVTSISLATNRTWKDSNGNKRDSSEFHNVVFFGRVAEVIAQYAKKGQSIYVEGRLQTRSWEGQDGRKNYRTEIVGENMQLGYRRDNDRKEPSNIDEAPQNEDETSIEYEEESGDGKLPY